MNALLLFLLILFADRFSKAWALKTLAHTEMAPFYGCNLVLTWNKGVSWSLFATSTEWGFFILTICISLTIAGFAWYTLWRTLHFQSIWCEAMVLGGALSNLMDRFFYGAVIDFIDLYVGPYHWPVFNFADVAICCGIAGIMLRAMHIEQKGCNKKRD